MRNYKNNRRRFRNNSFDRSLKINSNDQTLNSNIGNISDFKKKSFGRNSFNSPKLIQKYTDLAREALSSGDKILYENYLQHAEHFIRISENNSSSSNLKDSPKPVVQASVSKIAEEDSIKQDKLAIKET